MNPKSISEWGLDKKSRKIVEKNIKLWLKLFIQQANGEQGNVYRADFIKNTFFYFTSCQDLMGTTPESKAVEMDIKIRARKQKVMLQLFCKTLLDINTVQRITCSHCGYDNVIIDGHSNGHFRYCPKCGKVDFSGYVGNELLDNAKEVVKKIEGGKYD